MKKTFLIIASTLLLASCATVYHPAPRTVVGIVNYAPLTSQGIFVTESNSVGFDYEALGSIFVFDKSGWVRKDGKDAKDVDPKEAYYIGSSSNKDWRRVEPTVEECLSKLASKLKSLGANGIINLKITTSYNVNPVDKVTYPEIAVTGMAIKK